jgi:acetyl-CoA synthetase
MPDSRASLDDHLEQLLQVEKFPPPGGFAAAAQLSDPAVYEEAAADPAAWWATQARERLQWDTPFSTVLDDSNPPFYTWFADGTINVTFNCLDRHVLAGRGDRVAFYWRGEEGEERELTYAELLDDVQRLASALKAQGVQKGDVVGIYLPMIPEVVVAMLACARIGAPASGPSPRSPRCSAPCGGRARAVPGRRGRGVPRPPRAGRSSCSAGSRARVRRWGSPGTGAGSAA